MKIRTATFILWSLIGVAASGTGLFPVLGLPHRPSRPLSKVCVYVHALVTSASILLFSVMETRAAQGTLPKLVNAGCGIVSCFVVWRACHRRQVMSDLLEYQRLYCARHPPSACQWLIAFAASLLPTLHILTVSCMIILEHGNLLKTVEENVPISSLGITFLSKIFYAILCIMYASYYCHPSAAFALALQPCLLTAIFAAGLHQECELLVSAGCEPSAPGAATEPSAGCTLSTTSCKTPEDHSKGARLWRALRVRHQLVFDMTQASNLASNERFFLLVYHGTVVATLMLSDLIMRLATPELGNMSQLRIFVFVTEASDLVTFVVLSIASQLFVYESSNIRKALHSYLVKGRDLLLDETKEVHLFIDQTLRLDSTFYVCGVIRIDRAFTVGVVSAVSTYIFVLIQSGALFSFPI